MRIMKLCLLALLFPSGSGVLAAEQDPPPLNEVKRLVDTSQDRVMVLENGLTVLLKAHRTAPVVTVRMYCRTGSLYEQEYLGCGMSHLFEHLLHGTETTTRSETESRRILDDIGGNTNAYTSYDKTCYFINTSREHTAQAISLLGDWLTHPTFPQEAFEREWGVVQRELERDEDNPDRQLFYMTMETMYLDHPARFPVIGHKPAVQSLTKEDIVGYYHRMYVPDRIVVTVVGDIDLDDVSSTIRHEFASFERRPVPTIVLPDEPEMTTPRRAMRRMQGVDAAVYRWAWPSIPLTHEDLYALDVLSYVLTEGNSSRLVRALRDEGLVLSIDSFSWTPPWGRGLFAINARIQPEKIEAATAGLMDQLQRVRRDGVTPEELDQAKRQKAAEHVFASQTAESVAEMISRDYLATGDIHFSEAYVDGIQQVTREQVRDMARKYLHPKNFATIAVLPESYQPPQDPALARAEPSPVKLVTLDNGLRVLIRRDPTTPLVAIQSFSLGGVYCEDEETSGLSRMAAVLAPRGTATRSAEEIARFFDSRGGNFNGTSGNNTIFFQGEVLSKDFAEAMEVFADVVCHPAFPEEEVERFRPMFVDQIRRVQESWRSELSSYLRSRFYVHSPYRYDTVGREEVVAQATRDDVARFYAELVTGPRTVLAIFGDVDPRSAEALARRYFSGLPATQTPLPAPEAEPSFEQPQLYIKTKGADRHVAGVAVGFHGMTFANVEDTVAMAVLDTIISGYRYPTGWLHEALRGGDRNYVYEVHALNFPGLSPGHFWIYAGCQPEMVGEVYDIIMEQLGRARKGEATEEELERAKTIIATTELMALQTNRDRAMQTAIDELYGLGYDYREHFREALRGVTLADVKYVAEKYLTAPVIAVVTNAPEAVEIGVEPILIEAPE